MSVNVVSAVLICRTGELAGVRFELSAEATIGRDSGNRVSVAADAQALSKWYARVFQRDGIYYLENLGAAGSVHAPTRTPTTTMNPTAARDAPTRCSMIRGSLR